MYISNKSQVMLTQLVQDQDSTMRTTSLGYQPALCLQAPNSVCILVSPAHVQMPSTYPLL